MNIAENFVYEVRNHEEVMENTYIQDFVQQLNMTEKTKSFYKSVLIDLFLFHGKGWNDISVEEHQRYLNYLTRVHLFKKISEKNLKKKTYVISQFLSYLHHREVGDFADLLLVMGGDINLKSGPNGRKSRGMKMENLPAIIEDFLLYLKNKGYHGLKDYKKRIIAFQRFLESGGENLSIFNEKGKETLLFEVINKYEENLSERISREEIQTSSATSYLRTVQLFVKYLASKGFVHKKYTIPIHLRGRSKRSNQYVPIDSTIKLMNAIYKNSNNSLRDLSIFLIIVDTGCRPIEVVNLMLGDVDTVERTLTLECGKTDRRKVKVSIEVMQVLKEYLSIRNEYFPKTEKLFVNPNGQPISTSTINMIFYIANKNAFGQSKYPARAFRHTYITNALEEHSFERVSKAIGHKDWKSTYYYYHRSKKRLLKNTLDKSPFEKGVNRDANQKAIQH